MSQSKKCLRCLKNPAEADRYICESCRRALNRRGWQLEASEDTR